MSNKKNSGKGNSNSLAIFAICAALLTVFVIALMICLLKNKKNDSETKTVSAESVEQTDQTLDPVESEGIPEATPEPTLEPTPEPTPEPEPVITETAPEAEDGSGAAGLMPMNESTMTLYSENGWFMDANNSWYSPDNVHVYYNGWANIDGENYHFDTAGMVDRGWKVIGGQSCYFGKTGIYYPDQDPNKVLAFTFDDGPSQGTTDLLDLCEETGARITFFLLGECLADYGYEVPRILADRCQLGSHSTEHIQMTTVSTEQCVADFQFSDQMIRECGGETSVYRFPYGDYTQEEKAAVGKPSIMWTLDSLDWDLKNTQAVIDRVLAQVEEGDIILMHDIYNTTIEACRYLFPYLQEQGYQLVTVAELAAAKGYTLEAGSAYYGFSNTRIEEGRVTE